MKQQQQVSDQLFYKLNNILLVLVSLEIKLHYWFSFFIFFFFLFHMGGWRYLVLVVVAPSYNLITNIYLFILFYFYSIKTIFCGVFGIRYMMYWVRLHTIHLGLSRPHYSGIHTWSLLFIMAASYKGTFDVTLCKTKFRSRCRNLRLVKNCY